jgi:glycosyltransferase involved in cell wall biosynthesis
MKILFFTPRFYPHIGGVERHVSEIANVLSKKNQITIVTEQYQDNLPLSEKLDDVQIFRIPVGQQKSLKLQIWLWILQNIRLILNADIIHVHDVFYWVLPFRLIFFWKKFYITFHGYEAPGPLSKKQIFWHRVAANLTHANICVGDFHCQVYGVQPTQVTYGGITDFPASITARTPQITFVGRIANDTGVWTYVRGLEKLHQQKTKFSATFYGDGSLRKELQKYALKKSLPITFPGPVPSPNQVYAQANLIFSSQYLGILQALAQEKKVIAVADSPLKKIYLSDTPFAEWITIVEDESELINALQKQLKKTAPLNTQATTWARKQTWQKLAHHYLQLYRK